MAHLIYSEDPAAVFTWMQGRKVRTAKDDGHGGTIRLSVLKGGMKSGRSSVSIAAELDDGSVVLLDTSLRLFMGITVGVMGKNIEELVAEDILAPSPVDPVTQFSDEQVGRMYAAAMDAGHGLDPNRLPPDAPERWENMDAQQRDFYVQAGRHMAKALLGGVTSHVRYGACPCGTWHQPKVR